MTQRNDITRNAILTTEQRAPRDVAINQGQVLLDTDHNEQGRLILERVEQGTSDILGAPHRLVVQAASEAFKLSGVGSGDFSIGAGHGWLDGWKIENANALAFTSQPHPPTGHIFDKQGAIGVKALVRYIDPVEEPAFADKALGNAQASGRTLIDWQVFPIPLSAADAASCATAYKTGEWKGISASSTGKAAFLVEASAASLDPCSLTPEGGYSRFENLLYRVEVHSGQDDPAINKADGPRFGLNKLKVKFSRRNASLMARVSKIAGSEITVFPPARDERNWFAPGQYAEIVSVHNDMDAVGSLKSETLFRISSINGDRVILEASGAEIVATGLADDGDWFLRLWDSFPDGEGTKEIALGGGGKSQKIDLGDGLALQLDGGGGARLRRGDYWCCAARADGTIEWPTNSGNFEFIPPQGPEIKYAILGVYQNNSGSLALKDCRVPFAPLTEQLQVMSLGGDGQEVLADSKNGNPVKLPFKLRVGVIRGSAPVAGETIRFAVLKGGGQLDGGGNSIIVQTDANGIAETEWFLGPIDFDQQVAAARIDEGGGPTHAPICFNGFLSRADQTSFDPSSTPSLAGAFDVQTAIEMLAGQGQVGCSTYVVQEGSDWIAVLETIKDGEDASICFQRGLFEADRTLTLANKGHLKISGAGPGTRIVIRDVEVAIEFKDCASVNLSHMHISAPTPGHQIKKIEHRQGSVTIYDCSDVAISDAVLECGPGSSAQRCCLRIAGQPLKDYRASVKECEFRAGYMQDGLIVSDCDQIAVRDNSFATVARPSIIDFTILVKDHRWTSTMKRGLIRSIRPMSPPKSGAGPIVKGKKYIAQMTSAIPQAEWNTLVEADPPKAADERSMAGFDRYVARIVAKVIEDPKLVPSFEANLNRLQENLGDKAKRQLSEPIRRNLLASDVGKAKPLREEAVPGMHWVWLDANGLFVRFLSPIPEQEWKAALKDSGQMGQISDFSSFNRTLNRLSKRLIADPDFAAKMPSFKPWLDGYVARLSSFSRDAISCVGKALGKVSISGNRIVDFQLGVRVATSHGKWTLLYTKDILKERNNVRLAARVVDIFDNQLLLRTQAPGAQAFFGMFFGHADTIRVHANDIHYADMRTDDEESAPLDYAEGIRLFGHFGRLVSVKDNHITVAPRAIRMTWDQTQHIPDTDWPYNWIFADNMGNWAKDEHVAIYLEVPDYNRIVNRNNRPPY